MHGVVSRAESIGQADDSSGHECCVVHKKLVDSFVVGKESGQDTTDCVRDSCWFSRTIVIKIETYGQSRALFYLQCIQALNQCQFSIYSPFDLLNTFTYDELALRRNIERYFILKSK